MTLACPAMALACACALMLAGLTAAVAQFLPGPGQSRAPVSFPRRRASQQRIPAAAQGRAASATRPARKPVAPPGGGSPAARATAFACNFRRSATGREGGRRHQGRQRSQGAARRDLRAVQEVRRSRKRRMVKFLETIKTSAAFRHMRSSQRQGQHAKSQQIRQEGLQRAAAAALPGPRLSDALGGPSSPTTPRRSLAAAPSTR